ncbi:head-tail connector protein [Pseudoroseicyclus aestuarii]|uniref:Putative phiE125 gp8 family phage protein n=1 Tax=Pseudoroseicyclus aestuarii TaxID=1795041 RepID=A0A318SWL2_9RHOB|nr:hypothetical protein [Pseudoroseicyclus aestuarii]PYE85715.1 putative phiE125 gp8 family phage protein [Pseudoroseicyclus aestuarii]
MVIEDGGIAEGALPLAAFRAHLRLGSGFAEEGLQDPVLAGFLRAALAAIEGRTGKVLLEREMALRLTCWSDPARQALPLAPVSAVVSVARVAADGVVLPVEGWRLVPDMQSPALEAGPGGWPALPPGGALRIAVLAGFGPEWTDAPADLRQAVLMLAAHYYEFRHDTGLGSGCMPFGVTALIERFRPVRLGGRG